LASSRIRTEENALGSLASTRLLATSAMSDQELCRRIAEGDVEAFDALYDRHAAHVNGVCFQYLRSHEESEEVLQEIFLALWEGKIVYRPERARLSTFLFSIAKNRCLDRLKASSRRLPHTAILADVISPDHDDPEVDAQVAEERLRIRKALAELPQAQREAIEFCFFRSSTYRDAADELRIPFGTLKGRVRAAMRRLAEILKPQEDDE